MPFLRFSRDKRGYEHTYLVHAAIRRGKAAAPRVLYWYRTPPGVKVGRPAFDEEARSTIESQNPGVTFDWKTLEATPIPPVPQVERWRERRRVERLAKLARRANEVEESPADPPEEEEGEVKVGEPEVDARDPRTADVSPLQDQVAQGEEAGEELGGEELGGEEPTEEGLEGALPITADTPRPDTNAPPAPGAMASRGRRRRRGGRGRTQGQGPMPQGEASQARVSQESSDPSGARSNGPGPGRPLPTSFESGD